MRYGAGSDWGKFREFRKLRELRFFSPNVLNFLNRPQAAQLSQQAAVHSTFSTGLRPLNFLNRPQATQLAQQAAGHSTFSTGRRPLNFLNLVFSNSVPPTAYHQC
jgi:hypothetical protein